MLIWYLSKERSLAITSFNKVEKNGTSELWVTELNGSSRKLAIGKKADDLERTLLDMVWNNFPSIINDGNGNFGVNIDMNEEEEVED